MAASHAFDFVGKIGTRRVTPPTASPRTFPTTARGTARTTDSGQSSALQSALDGSGSTADSITATAPTRSEKRVLVRQILDLADELPPGRVNGRALTDRIAYALGIDEAFVDDTINGDRKASRCGLSMALVGMDGLKAEVRSAMRDAAEEIYAGHGERGPQRRGAGRVEA